MIKYTSSCNGGALKSHWENVRSGFSKMSFKNK